MTSLEIKEFAITLENFIHDYNLPWEVKRMVLANTLAQVEVIAENEINTQYLARKEQSENEQGLFEDKLAE